MYDEGVEWSGAASAKVVSTEYFGTAQKKQMQSPHISALIPFTALPFPIKSYFGLNMVWKGRLT